MNVQCQKEQNINLLGMKIEFLEKWKSIVFNKILHRIIHIIIQLNYRCNSVITITERFKNSYEDSPRLSKQDAETLHSIVTKLIWVEKRGRSNIEPAVSFLYTGVTSSTIEFK